MIMENNDHTNNYYNHLRDLDGYSEDDALLFCDLPMNKKEESMLCVCPENQNIQNQDLFEFFSNNPNYSKPNPSTETVVFCGKTMLPKTVQEFQRHPNNGLYIRRDSFKRCHSLRSESSFAEPPSMISTADRPNSFRIGGSVSSPATRNTQYNNSASQRHKVLIGLVKVQSKMELSEMRKRQSRRSPAPMFSVADAGRLALVGDDVVVGKRSHWGLLGPLRCRSHLVSTLAKFSFGCMHRHV